GRGVHAIENPGVADGNLADRLVQDAAVQAASVDLDVGQFGHDAAFQAARSQSAWTLSGLPTVSAWRQPRSRSGSKPVNGTHASSERTRIAPPVAATRGTPPATSQTLGEAKRATCNRPAATKEHSTA